MAKATGTLWVDLTMLINSLGTHLTGIQRVEYNLAKRYAELPHVKFCVFHKDRRKLVEFDFKHVAHRVEMLHAQGVGGSSPVAIVKAPVHRRILVKTKRTVAPLLSTHTKEVLRRQYHRLKSFNAPTEDQILVEFKKDDTFLVLSGDWSDEIFANLIAELRAKLHFKIVQIVYDMLPAFHPAFFVPGMADQFTTYMKSMFENCDGVLAISQATKRDVERFMDSNKIKRVPVQVFRLGDDLLKKKSVKPELNIKKGDYLLCVCTIEARKNHMLLYYAVRESIARGEDIPPFVLVGKRGWLANDFLYLVENDPEISKKFMFTNCTDQELAWLYENCLLSVLPTFYEGWGLGVSESLFYGKFCLASNTSSIPEIGGDMIDYFSPNDPVTLFEKIKFYAKNPKELAAKEARIKAEYKQTLWDDAFKQVDEFVKTFQR